MSETVHLYDAGAKQSLCASAEREKLAWTVDPAHVTCEECRVLLRSSAMDEPDDGESRWQRCLHVAGGARGE